ncbi:MAG: sulfite exporter TauE/SafE family protein [Desulfovibrionaceae bacterium]|nr:sulfite exporter TauE/SafE family protein [Desulfovibrionaceae bacterium]
MTLFFALSCLVVGFLCGATSIGGILLIPAIQYSAGLSLPVAAGTALCSFFFTGMVGTWVHWRGGRLEKPLVIPQCAGALLFGCLGAFTKYIVGAVALNTILALFIIAAGVATLRPPHPMRSMQTEKGRARYLFFVGSFAGFMAGLTGMGGPILSIPLMIIMGFAPLTTVAAAQPFQLVACFSGTVGNIILDQINWQLALFSVAIQSAGLWTGVCLARRVDTSWLKVAISFLCVFTGIMMLFR